MAIINCKGGSGKTTTAVNVSAALALRGESVLLVDIDPQANASIHVGVDIYKQPVTIYELLLGMESSAQKAIVKTKVTNMSVIPSAIRLAGAELELAPVIGRERLLKTIFDNIEGLYSYIIVDCPVSFALLSLNALVACDEVLAPVQTHFFSYTALEQLTKIMDMVTESLNPDLKLIGLAPTMCDKRTKAGAKLVKKMEERFGKNIVRPGVRLDAKLNEAPGRGKPIQLYAPKSNGAYDYTVLADDIRIM